MGAERLEMNAAMKALQPDLTEKPDVLAPELTSIIASGFEDCDGLVILRRYAASAQNVVDREDAVGAEAFVNHVHVEDVLGAAPRDRLLIQTWAYVAALAAALRGSHPDDAFELSAAVSDSYMVRFHKVRPGARWLADDLEGYASEAVLRLTIAQNQR